MSQISILKYGFAIISFISFVISFITFLIQKRKTGILSNLNEVLQICQDIPELVKEAEDVYPSQGLGVLKLQYVLNKLEIRCVKQSIDYYTLEESFKVKIEEILSAPQKKE